MDVGYEKFLGPELFFSPEIFSTEFTQTLPEIVDGMGVPPGTGVLCSGAWAVVRDVAALCSSALIGRVGALLCIHASGAATAVKAPAY